MSVYVTGKDFLNSDNSYSNKFLNNHIWVLTYVITVALNSLVNPLVYMLRMTSLRESILARLRGVTREISGQFRDTNTAGGGRVSSNDKVLESRV